MPISKLTLKLTKPIAALVALSVLLSGCSLLPSSKKDQNITLKYWGLWESQTTIGQIISDYKKIKPNVNIVYEKKAPQQYRESIESQIESGKGPDIFVFHNTWTPMLKEELSTVPSSVVPQSTFKKDYYPTVFYDLRNTNKQFVGVPLEIDGLALFWNVDIFKAAGLTTPPATWSDLAATAAKLTVKDTSGNIKTAGVALGTASNVEHFSDILGLMIYQNGGDPKTPTEQKTADALEFYTKFAKGENRVWDQAMPRSTLAFAGNNLAMYFGPSWRAIEIKNANPLLNFKVAPVPQLEGNKVGWASYWAHGVSAKSPHQDEAWEFIKYLSQEQTLIKMFSEAAKSPGRFFGEPYPKVSMAQKVPTDSPVGAYLADAPYMRSFPMASKTHDNGLNDQIVKAYEDAVNAVISGTSAKSALDITAKNINAILSRYNATTATAPSK